MTEKQFFGWLLDLYEDQQTGIVLWFISESGHRYRLQQRFPLTFHIAAPEKMLEEISTKLANSTHPLKFWRSTQNDLFSPCPIAALSLQVAQPAFQRALIFELTRSFPTATFYNIDIPITLRYAAVYNTFPMCRCHVGYSSRGELQELEVLDTPWELDPILPKLSILSLQPNVDPHHAQPGSLLVEMNERFCYIPLHPIRSLLNSLHALLEQNDPDLILTRWGDTWLIAWLQQQSGNLKLPIRLSRDPGYNIAWSKARSYFSYGQIVYRGQQIQLFGRWHIDACNATLWDDYGLEGTLEFARVTGLSVQAAARSSPGTGISSMQILTALRSNILVPWHKQQPEIPKTALALLRYDQGGMVYQPTPGVHKNVGEIDFVSMYPSLMVRYNISPETCAPQPLAEPVMSPGLIPRTLAPLLAKRIALKKRLALLLPDSQSCQIEKARSSIHKWLLVTCFGYLGYKNARFGRIESHEAVTACSRETLLRAKEIAEELGFDILHLYVDALWVIKPDAKTPQDYLLLLDRIAEQTGLSISLDGIYRWVVFLSSRVEERVPVPNRYFGVFQDGSIKVRGIEARRRDTAPFVAAVQMELLEHLAQADSADQIPNFIPGARHILQSRLAQLRAGSIPLEQLLVSQKVSRELTAYSNPTPAVVAAKQLAQIGKTTLPGQRIRFLYTRGYPGAYAWDLSEPVDFRTIDQGRYVTLLIRAADTILSPFGAPSHMLSAWADQVPLDIPLLPESTQFR
jgi:DNA polymerase-2